ncbi:MAG: hypothetical protein A2W31_02070 [Planctomycetes bacterium RBG_16_64_10]|nr:MAG: hypothetical protein A2W31_02070 [Planctomycetes bacterium RBG_16_64_10]
MEHHQTEKTDVNRAVLRTIALAVVMTGPGASIAGVQPGGDLTALEGRLADIAPSSYQYRADRPAADNPPESWLLLIQYAGLPYDKPVEVNAPALKNVLSGLLWEEVRPIRRVELTWDVQTAKIPPPDQLALTYFDATDQNAHTWWNPATKRQADKPQVSPDNRTYVYAIPVDTWGIVVSTRGDRSASAYSVPTIRAVVPDVWNRMDLEIEWGFDATGAALDYSGHIEVYDGVVGHVRSLAGDTGTTMTGPLTWRSVSAGAARRGVRMSVLTMGRSTWRRVWPYDAQAEDVARTILTVWTRSGNFSFLAADLENGPILAPEFGFFVRATGLVRSQPGPAEAARPAPVPHAPPFPLESQATSAREFRQELAAKGRSTIRQRVRRHPEQTWDQAVQAMHPGMALPPHPEPPFAPAMQVEVPCQRLTAQWKLGPWHILRHSVKDQTGKWSFNDFPYGILASETYMILRVLDLQGMHQEAADGLDQWLRLPLEPKVVPGQGGHHDWALADRPLGQFSDGRGCLTHAEGPPGAGGHMDGVHGMGPGAVAYALSEHFRLTGDMAWLKAAAPRITANATWILRQRQLLARNIPGGQRLWSKGLQPAHVVTPDSHRMHMQFYETEAYYWLAVQRTAELLALIDPDEGAQLAAEAEAYRKDLRAAIDRSIVLAPVVAVRDGTYRSFVPFAPYVRGLAAGAWGWRRCQGHVGAIYWDTVQSADPLISPAGLLAPDDVRVQGHLDVLEDRLLLENTKVNARTASYDPDEHWFSHASWQYQCGLERHANVHLETDDVPNYLRSMLNQYAVEIMPGEYTFREHTTGGPPDKIYEESCFLERLRNMLVMEEGDSLWLARATPRDWLRQGNKIALRNAPTHFGIVAYEIVSDVDNGRITAAVELPARRLPNSVLLRLRHPQAVPMSTVTVNGKPWTGLDPEKEVVHLEGLNGTVKIQARYSQRTVP